MRSSRRVGPDLWHHDPGGCRHGECLSPESVGVVLDEDFQTWDGVDEATARMIVSELTDVARSLARLCPGEPIVALTLAIERDRILRTVETVSPSVVHLVRAAGEMPPEILASLRDELDPIKLMLTVPVRNEASVTRARNLAGATDYLLLDSAHPQAGWRYRPGPRLGSESPNRGVMRRSERARWRPRTDQRS
jgi:phosphoribosylanthranilate isomerase